MVSLLQLLDKVRLITKDFGQRVWCLMVVVRLLRCARFQIVALLNVLGFALLFEVDALVDTLCTPQLESLLPRLV